MAEYVTETTETFLVRLNTLITHGFVSVAISLGVETGLFDALVKLKEEDRTSQEIADVAGLKERYVREWLGAMVVANIVDINLETEKYRLPSHRVPCFTRGSDVSDLATYATAIPMIAEVYDKLAHCMERKGPSGMAYSDYTHFYPFITKLSSRWLHNNLVQDFVPSMPTIEEGLKSGINVLDLGCGRGDSTNIFAEHYPHSSIVGLDISEEGINSGRDSAKEKNLSNVQFICCDAASLPCHWSDTMDYIYAYNAVHDFAYADKVLKEIYRVLKPGGVFSMIDPDCRTKHSHNLSREEISRIYTLSLFHCLPVSLYFKDSLGLGQAWGREGAIQMLKECNFSVDSITNPTGNPRVHYMCSKPK